MPNENLQNENTDETVSNNSVENGAKTQNLSIFEKFLELVTGVGSEERIKQRKLKEVSKELNSLKFKFYNFKKDQVLPQFGEYFYEIYRICQNFTRFFDVKNHNVTIKQFLFEFIIPKKQLEIKQKLERDKIEELIRNSKDTKVAFEQIKQLLSDFVKSFDNDTVKSINNTYNQIVDISNLTNFDWFFLVHKFDSAIAEGNFNYKPNFEILEGKYILEEIIAINDYIYSINLNMDWKSVFEYLKAISGENGVVDLLKKLLQLIKVLKRDDYLLKMIKLISKDPFFKHKEFVSKAKIVQDYIRDFQLEVQGIVQICVKEIGKEKINKLLLEIFRTTVIVRLKNYSQKINDFLLNKGVNSQLKYIDPLNYLKAFLLDICKGEIKTRVDFLIIKGTWESNTKSSEYSAVLEKFNNLSDKLLEFDNRCSEDDTYGRELRKLSGVLKHDPKARLSVKKVLARIDNDAVKLLLEGIEVFTIGAGKIKVLIEDYNQKIPKIIIDFHKIKWDFSSDINKDLTEIYKKLYNMVNLLRNYAKESDVQKESEETGEEK